MASEATREVLLRMRGITKDFPGVRALSSVDFEVRRGEVHALMGENGAGKSTLINVLTGVHPREAGSIELEGSPIDPTSPREAEALGISTVYQEVNLIPQLSVAENVVLGRQPRRWGFFDRRAIRRRAERTLARLEVRVDVQAELGSCSVAVQQMVAIARALDVRARLLVLDEPTSSLDEREVAELFRALRRLREEGLGVVFITHFLDQVYEVADRITVLRNGERVGQLETAELPRLRLIGMMLGRSIEREVESARAPAAKAPRGGEGEVFLSARGLRRRGGVGPLDMEVRTGEVLGLAGLLGSGRPELARLLFGIDRADAGEVRVEGRPAPLRSPREAIARGLAFCPEDRKRQGIVPNLSVRENIVLALQASRGARRSLSGSERQAIAEHWIRALDIRAPGPDTPLFALSGGNQQKVLLARWLAMQPRLIILDEPSRGVDVGARSEIARLVESLRAEGMAIVLISSELDELVRGCGRALVLRDRLCAGELEGEELDEEGIMALIARAP